MTVTLPSFIEILGLFGLGTICGAVVFLVTALIGVGFMDSSELGSIAMVLIWPLTIIGFIAGVVIGWTWLL